MLYLTRKVGETVVVNDDVRITVVEVRGKSIKLGFTFPPSVSVLREELYDRIQEENRAAAQTSIDMAASFGAIGRSIDADTKTMRSTSTKKVSVASTPNLDAMMAGGMFGDDEKLSLSPLAQPETQNAVEEQTIEFLIEGEEDIAADNQAANEAWGSEGRESVAQDGAKPQRRTLTLGDER